MPTVKCKNCGEAFEARHADIRRGWGKFCTKSCKASAQSRETGITGPDYRASKMTVGQMKKGKFAKSQFAGRKSSRDGIMWYKSIIDYSEFDECVIDGSVKYSHRHRCWLESDESDVLAGANPFDSDAAGFNNT